MRRASASNSFPGEQGRAWHPILLVRGLFAGALIVVMTVGASAVSVAADNGDENDAGQLNLNTAVLVNESVGAGASGDFAIRSALFSEGLAERVHEQRERQASRLQIVDTLGFERTNSAAVDYQPVKAGLFDDYSPVVLQSGREEHETSPRFYGVIAVLAVPLVLLTGVLLGRLWARRKRAAL